MNKILTEVNKDINVGKSVHENSEKLHQLHSGDATQRNKLNRNTYRLRTFNQVVEVAKNLPPAINLFGNLIFQGEVTILAGDTGVGKSLLAGDIAIKIAKGLPGASPLINQSGALKTFYVDYELTDRQFSKRFSREDYPANLFRIDANPDCIGCGLSLSTIIKMVHEQKPELLILDNLSAAIMDSGKDAEIAIKVMAEMKKLQKELNMTVIVIAHTPKRLENMPLRVDNVGGSKHIANFADSIFFIAKSSQGKNVRYMKHVKGRNSEIEEEVYLLNLVADANGIHFEYKGMDDEKNHLADYYAGEDKSSRNDEIKKMYAAGKSMEEIAAHFGINKSTVSRIIGK